ncbi:hypothetical protein LdCL_340037100 [Leishmania donovani]|uniref:Uncharacterized protein n=1 Tax=Leishmania donovani TaxID=5661 RepID=A0A3S7X888_LEIDO|nr:hypothetical protein LdCL_340037100 [Leishmania donovani]
MLPATDSIRMGVIQADAGAPTAAQQTDWSFSAQLDEAGRHVNRVASFDDHGTSAVSLNDASASAFVQRARGVGVAAPSAPDPQQPEEVQELPIEEVVNSTVIHLDKPIEHMPLISPPELKLVGRCVTFKGDTTINGETRSFFYEGLIGTINKETVMLIHVHRYTEEDFQLHKLERRHAFRADENLKSSQQGVAVAPSNCAVEGISSGGHGGTAREEIEANYSNDNLNCVRNPVVAESIQKPKDDDDNFDFDFDHHSISVTEHQEMPALLNALGETHAEEATRVRNRMQQQKGTMGPIPYVTFSRSHIHRVEFGVDPQSSFYSIFRDPTKEYFDMQCLRMFVRRYIIHTSQGNNPRCVPLRAFITSRCNCPDLDNDLLERTTREELAHLIKIDRDVKRVKKKKEQNRRNALRAYRAPQGLFRLTGILFLTHLPQQTLSIAVMEMIVTLVLLIYMLTTILTAELNIVGIYFAKVYPYIFCTVIVSVLATACTSLHAIRMSLPIRDGIFVASMRAFFTLSATACSTMAMIIIGGHASYERLLSFVESDVMAPRLCGFYSAQRCSGITIPCTSIYADKRLCNCFHMQYDSYPCQSIMIAYVQRGLIPMVCLAFILFATFFFDGYLHLRLFHIAHLLEGRL